MGNNVHCPDCGCEFELSAILRHELEDEVRTGLLAKMRGELNAAAQKQAEVLKRQRELEDREQRLALQIEERLAAERSQIFAEASKAAQERLGREAGARIDDARREVEEMRQKLVASSAKEAALMQHARELEGRQARVDLEIEERLTKETQRIREEEVARVRERMALEQERQRLKDEEHRNTIDGLKQRAADLQRRLDQGSQQAQGEAQETLLAHALREAFVGDLIEDVAKGALGGDVVQHVRGAEGRTGGTIVWESKRTKTWSDEWLRKAREDQRRIGATCAVVVSQALPAGVQTFALREGVWVCAWPVAVALATVLRAGIVDVDTARRVAEGRGEKMHMLFDYLTGTEFRNRVGGFVEAFQDLQTELDQEKRAMYTAWKRREKTMQKAAENMAAFYGELQGIAGQRLADLPALSLGPHALPRGDADTLAGLLFSLVPADGSSVGNASLAAAFTERALVDLGVEVSAAEYERCKNVLVDDGRLRRGRGQGGSLSRVVMGRAA